MFIGNRSIPSAYGLTPFSFILKNTGDNNFQVVQKRRFGMITDSKWADLDKDGFVELILAGDWMPILIFSYTKEGNFKNKTKDFGLDKTNGMWNVIKIADLNKDGFLDIIGGNTGENFKWKASEEKPVKMYLDDFDKNTQLNQLIFYDYFGTDVTFASKDKLTQQLPILKKKFTSYTSFSKVNAITDLFDKNEKDILETKYIYELRSMFYLNSGSNFTGKALPKEAQISTIEDFYIDTNEIIYTGNYNGFVTELGKSDGNPGGILHFTNNTIQKQKSLQLPKEFSGRKIVKLTKNNYLVLSNNGNSYIIDTQKLDK